MELRKKESDLPLTLLNVSNIMWSRASIELTTNDFHLTVHVVA
jgi:hypothetical protein